MTAVTALSSAAAIDTPTPTMLENMRTTKLPTPGAGHRCSVGAYVQSLDTDNAVAIVRGAYLSDFIVYSTRGTLERWNPRKCHRLTVTTGARLYKEQGAAWDGLQAHMADEALERDNVARVFDELPPEPMYTGETEHTVAVALAQYYGGVRRHVAHELATLTRESADETDATFMETYDNHQRALRSLLADFKDATARELHHGAVAVGRESYATPSVLS